MQTPLPCERSRSKDWLRKTAILPPWYVPMIFPFYTCAMMKITLSSSLGGDGSGLEAGLKDCSAA
jgi:hypothetical protein